MIGILGLMEKSDWIWMNGEFVAWDQAQVHVLSHGLHYGSGVFEGIRCYETEQGPAVFRHLEHMQRLENSAELYYLPLSYSAEELRKATTELIARNWSLQLLHPAAGVSRLRRDGPLRAGGAGRGRDRRLAVGLLPR